MFRTFQLAIFSVRAMVKQQSQNHTALADAFHQRQVSLILLHNVIKIEALNLIQNYRY